MLRSAFFPKLRVFDQWNPKSYLSERVVSPVVQEGMRSFMDGIGEIERMELTAF